MTWQAFQPDGMSGHKQSLRCHWKEHWILIRSMSGVYHICCLQSHQKCLKPYHKESSKLSETCTGWLWWSGTLVGFTLIFNVPPPCPVDQPIPPNSHLPKQNQVDRGMTKIIVNPTQVHNHQNHPVVECISKLRRRRCFNVMWKGLALTTRWARARRTRTGRPRSGRRRSRQSRRSDRFRDRSVTPT